MNTIAHLPTPQNRRKAAATAAVEAVTQLSARKSTRRKSPGKRTPTQAEIPSTEPIRCGQRLSKNIVRIRLFMRAGSKFWQVSIRFQGRHKRVSAHTQNMHTAHAFAGLAYREFFDLDKARQPASGGADSPPTAETLLLF